MTAVPKDAATVLLLRETVGAQPGIEVLMVKRHIKSEFAGDAYVFPGGGVEDTDYEKSTEGICSGLTLEQARAIIKDTPHPDRALGFFVAAIRETFEEAGILLAYQGANELLSFDKEKAARFISHRAEMQENHLSFAEMVCNEGLMLAVDQLSYFAHWITPEFSPIRFDTHFFLAPAPLAQEAIHDAVETTAHIWISPHEAIEKSTQGQFSMLPPTVANLRVLAEFSSVDEAISRTRNKEVPTILPKAVFEDGKMRVLMPGDPGY